MGGAFGVSMAKMIRKDVLTDTELLIASYIAHGFSIQQIADMMCIEYDSVRIHLNRIYRTLNIGSHSLRKWKQFRLRLWFAWSRIHLYPEDYDFDTRVTDEEYWDSDLRRYEE